MQTAIRSNGVVMKSTILEFVLTTHFNICNKGNTTFANTIQKTWVMSQKGNRSSKQHDRNTCGHPKMCDLCTHFRRVEIREGCIYTQSWEIYLSSLLLKPMEWLIDLYIKGKTNIKEDSLEQHADLKGKSAKSTLHYIRSIKKYLTTANTIYVHS